MNIPGFYFDPVKKKYFKIQKNHFAPPDSQYSREAVKNRQVQARTEQRQDQHRQRVHSQRLRHDPRLLHPLTSLQVRLGNTGPGSAASTVAAYYGAALQRCTKPVVALESTSSHFALGTFEGRSVLVGSFLPNSGTTEAAICLQPLDEDCHSTSQPQHLHQTTGIVNSMIMTRKGPRWTENPGGPGTTQLHVIGRNSHVQYTCHNMEKLQLAASPSGNYWLGCSTSNMMFTDELAGLDTCVLPSTIPAYPKNDDLLTAAFKGEFIIMTGYRSGFVDFFDHRDASATQVRRLRHDSPVNHLLSLKDDHFILVNGMTSTKIYDLRLVKAPRPDTKRPHYSQPFVVFSIAGRTSDRVDLGLAYCPELNIAAIASSEGESHHVTLYSTRTGKVIPSALNDTQLEEHVSCLKFTSPRCGPPGLLMVPKGGATMLMEWRCDV